MERWTRKNVSYFVTAFFVLAVLLIISLIFLGANPEDNPQLALDLAFGGVVLAGVAVALSLVSIGHSIVAADVCIFLGDKSSFSNGSNRVMQQINIQNKGNGMGNIASVFVEIKAPSTSPFEFTEATGLTFVPTGKVSHKQYRFDDPINPRPLYPARYMWSNVGFISGPKDAHVKFSVQVVGTQGRTFKEFEFTG